MPAVTLKAALLLSLAAFSSATTVAAGHAAQQVAVLDLEIPKTNVHDSFYTVSLDFQGQKLPVLLDTGSDDIMVASEQCNNTNPKSGCYKSKLFHITKAVKVKKGKPFFTDVGEGGVSGNQSFVDVGFGKIKMKDLATPLIYEAVPLEFQNGAFSGILGMGLRNVSREYHFFKKLPPFDKLVKDKLLAKPVFSLTCPRYGDPTSKKGKLTLGSIEPLKESHDLTYSNIIPVTDYNIKGHPRTDQVWTQILEGIRFNGKSIKLHKSIFTKNGSQTALIDSGGINMLFGVPEFNQMAANLRGHKSVTPDEETYFECSVPQVLELKFHGKWFPVDPLDIIVAGKTKVVNGTTLCLAAFRTGNVAFGDNLLGPPFLKNVLAVFDYVTDKFYAKQPRVGFASLTNIKSAVAHYPKAYHARLK